MNGDDGLPLCNHAKLYLPVITCADRAGVTSYRGNSGNTVHQGGARYGNGIASANRRP
jgi:hypothetical protein